MCWDDTISGTEGRGESLIGHVHLLPITHKAEDVFDVTGTAGALKLNGKNVALFNASGNQILKMQDTSTEGDVVQDMLHLFGQYASGKSAEYPGSLKNLADTISIIDATRRSFESGKPEYLRPIPGAANKWTRASLVGQHFVWPIITPQVVGAVVNQMHTSLSICNRSGIYEKFEDRWRKMHGLKHALVCNTGTAAIHVSSIALLFIQIFAILIQMFL
jgi:hypothetical protein